MQYVTKFQQEVPKMIVFGSDKSYELSLPEYTDVFGKPATIKVQMDDTSAFFIFDPIANKFTTFGDISMLADYVGDYKAKMTLTDSVGNSIDYELKIAVTPTEG